MYIGKTIAKVWHPKMFLLAQRKRECEAHFLKRECLFLPLKLVINLLKVITKAKIGLRVNVPLKMVLSASRILRTMECVVETSQTRARLLL